MSLATRVAQEINSVRTEKVTRLGTELVPNGTFTGGNTTGWTPTGATLSVNTSKQMVIQDTGAGQVGTPINVVNGKEYRVRCDVFQDDGKSSYIAYRLAPGGVNTGIATAFLMNKSGSNYHTFTANSTGVIYLSIEYYNNGSGTENGLLVVDNVSAKEVNEIDNLQVTNELAVGDIENVESQVVLNSRPELLPNNLFDTTAAWDTTNAAVTIAGGDLTISPSIDGWIYASTLEAIQVKPNTSYILKVVAESTVGNIYYGKVRVNRQNIANGTNDIVTVDVNIVSNVANTPKTTEIRFDSGSSSELFVILGAYFANGVVKYDEVSLVEVDAVDNLQVQDTLYVNTDGLSDSTVDHKLQVDGYVQHKSGWSDMIMNFSYPGTGGAAPSEVADPDGFRTLSFGSNDEISQYHHVNHNFKPNTNAYPHVHWVPATAMSVGETVVWEVAYKRARGHDQNESFFGGVTTFTITYTASEARVAGNHVVSECSDLQAFDLLEPDTLIGVKIKRLAGTYSGAVYAYFADLHHESDREVTLNKAPSFN